MELPPSLNSSLLYHLLYLISSSALVYLGDLVFLVYLVCLVYLVYLVSLVSVWLITYRVNGLTTVVVREAFNVVLFQVFTILDFDHLHGNPASVLQPMKGRFGDIGRFVLVDEDLLISY